MNVKIIGIPSYSGGLYSGTEIAPFSFRDNGLIQTLQKAQIDVQDLGNVNLASFLPRHNIGPIRNWPSPRIVWEEMRIQSKEWFNDEDFVLILGGDCSIITGSMNGLYDIYNDKIYLISIDAHLDAVKPDAKRCIGAAAMGLWFLVSDNMFYSKPENFNGDHISVLATQENYEESYGISLFSLETLREAGISKITDKVMQELPMDAKVFVHLDLDAIIKDELSAVYTPSQEGLTLEEAKELLSYIVLDRRVIGMEVAEFSGIKDPDGSEASKVNKLLADTLKQRNIQESSLNKSNNHI